MQDFRLNFNNTAVGTLPSPLRFFFKPGDVGLSGPFALSLLIHTALAFVTLGGMLQASKQPFGVRIERVGVPGGGAPAIVLSEFDVDYSLPSDVALPKKKRKKATPVPLPKDETVSPEGGGRLGNATHGSESGVMGDPNGIQVSVRERYLYELKTFFDQRKTYPTSARTLGQTGQVEISFQIKKDGSVVDVAIAKPTTYERLNQAALALVKDAKSFKPIPTELGVESWKLTVPIRYELN